MCLTITGYTGPDCGEEIDECETLQPCMNNGRCTDLLNDYHCQCNHQFGGKNCTVPLVGCHNHTCLNDAICIPFLQDEAQGNCDSFVIVL